MNVVITSYSFSGAAEGRRDLRLTIARDGSAEADGAVLFPSGEGFVVLKAEPGTARCACADPNGDGRIGITQVAFQARDPRSGSVVPVTLAPARETEEIDRFDRYEVEIRAGGQPGVVTILVIPAQRRRRRRGNPRRRR